MHGMKHTRLTPAPERRYWVARFLEEDDLVGQISDTLVVTVPGLG
jgi:hypothetical protein